MVQTKSSSVYDPVYDPVWVLSPSPLQDACLDSIIDNLPKITEKKQVEDKDGICEKRTEFTGDPYVPDKMAEKLLRHASVKGKLTNDNLSLFSSGDFRLKVVQLPEIDINQNGHELLKFAKFSLRELELGNTILPGRWSIPKLISSFSGSTETLHTLTLNLFPAVSVTSGTILDFVSGFYNLRNFTYITPVTGNGVAFTSDNWERLLCNCSKLQYLNIHFNGSSQDMQLDSHVFSRHAQSLRCLTLHSALKSAEAIKSATCVTGFAMLNNLRVLDLSIDVDPQEVYQTIEDPESTETLHHSKLATQVTVFLKLAQTSMAWLQSLDISGILLLKDPAIEAFLDGHPKLEFLGLCMLHSKYCLHEAVADLVSHVEISGTVLEKQIVTSMVRYKNRATYLKEAFKGLFQVSTMWEARRPYILQIVLDAMKRYQQYLQLQMAATACVFNLTKDSEASSKESQELHVVLLSRVATITTEILVLYMGNIQMVKNCLLIICTDRILHHAKFDRVAMSRLCLNCMLKYQEETDRHVTRMAVAIVSILACKISSSETTALMQDKEMKLLLDIVQRRLETPLNDGTLKFDLSALWNLTDESPQACQLFVTHDGLIIYLKLLEAFPDEEHIQAKVLGLLNNIAEVTSLHNVMLQNADLMNHVRVLMGSPQVQVSYFACGIIANLALFWDQYHILHLLTIEKKDMLTELALAVERWGTLKAEIVTYRSFKPFYGLLECSSKPEIQLWAVWAIHHVCTLAADHYRNLMTDECLIMLDVIRRTTLSRFPRVQCEQIFEVCQKWPPRRHTSV